MLHSNCIRVIQDKMLMNNYTQKSILLVGNHAIAHLDNMRINFNKNFNLNYLCYQSGNPFNDGESNQLIFNDVEITYNGSYDLNNLTLALCFMIEHEQSLSSNDIIIGDPSELLFQAFSFARLKENPLFFKQKKTSVKADKALNIFIYPMGMICSDVRKEISNLIYILKKNESISYLIRKEEPELDEFLKEIFTELEKNSIYDIETNLEGLEHLTGIRKKETIS